MGYTTYIYYRHTLYRQLWYILHIQAYILQVDMRYTAYTNIHLTGRYEIYCICIHHAGSYEINCIYRHTPYRQLWDILHIYWHTLYRQLWHKLHKQTYTLQAAMRYNAYTDIHLTGNYDIYYTYRHTLYRQLWDILHIFIHHTGSYEIYYIYRHTPYRQLWYILHIQTYTLQTAMRYTTYTSKHLAGSYEIYYIYRHTPYRQLWDCILMVSCQKGPTRHAYACQIGPFWQDTLDIQTHTLQAARNKLMIYTICLLL